MVFLGILIICFYLILNLYVAYNAFIFLNTLNVSIGFVPIVIVIVLLALSYVFSRLPVPLDRLKRFCKIIGSYYFAVFEFLLIALPLGNIVYYILKYTGSNTATVIISIGTITLSLLIVFLIYGTYLAWSTVVRKYHIKIPKKVNGKKEMKIAMASDLHLGDIVGTKHLQKLVSKINEMNADIVLFPGDVIDDVVEPFLDKNMSAILNEIKSVNGEYAVLGNHEYYGGHIPRYVEEMKKINIPVLQDEVVSLPNGVYIVGRKDKTASKMKGDSRKEWKELVEPIPKDAPIIAMDHQPYAFLEAEKAGVDLLLCGHTHRGQFSPNHFITKKVFELDWGYLKKESLQIIVSSGFGTWGPPVRLGSQSEIIEINITFE